MRDLCVDNQESLQQKSDQSPYDESISVECSDEENYEITPEDMVMVYTRVAKGDLELSQKLVRVRSPSPDVVEEQTVVARKIEDERREEVTEEKPMVEEFDFDNFTETSRIITPRRSIGSVKTPRNTQKRVAQWDKIMNDYMKYQKLEEKSEPPKEAAAATTPATSTMPVASTISAPQTTSTTLTAKNIPINIVTETDLEMVISIGAATVAVPQDESMADEDTSTKPSDDSSKEAFDNGKQKE